MTEQASPPRVFQAMAVRSALKLFIATGIKVNTAYTPTAMLRTAGNILGKPYKRGELQQAHDDLGAWILAQHAMASTKH